MNDEVALIYDFFENPEPTRFLALEPKVQEFIYIVAVHCIDEPVGDQSLAHQVALCWKIMEKKNQSSSWHDFDTSEWFLFIRNGCGYCKKAKDLMKEKGIHFGEQEIDENNKEEIYGVIDIYTNNYRYFPVIFHNGKFIGGYAELEKIV